MLLLSSSFFALIWKQIRIRAVNEAVLRMELTLSTLTEKPGEPASVYVSFYHYWLNKECLLPDLSKDAGKRKTGLVVLPLCVYVAGEL